MIGTTPTEIIYRPLTFRIEKSAMFWNRTMYGHKYITYDLKDVKHVHSKVKNMVSDKKINHAYNIFLKSKLFDHIVTDIMPIDWNKSSKIHTNLYYVWLNEKKTIDMIDKKRDLLNVIQHDKKLGCLSNCKKEVSFDKRLDYLLVHKKTIVLDTDEVNPDSIKKLLVHAIYYSHTSLLDACFRKYPYMCFDIMYRYMVVILAAESYDTFNHLCKHYEKFVFFDTRICRLFFAFDLKMFYMYLYAFFKDAPDRKCIVIGLNEANPPSNLGSRKRVIKRRYSI